MSSGDPVPGSPAPRSKLVETLATSFAAGLATALPAAVLVVLQKPTWIVVVSILVTCVAVGIGSYGFISGRRRKSLNRLPDQAALLGPQSTDQQERDEFRQEMSTVIFAALWNRADPSEPMNPLTLADLLTHRSPHRTPEDLVRNVEEIRLLRILPTLERDRDGYFLNSDDFRFNQAMAQEGKKQIALAAASYSTRRLGRLRRR